MVSPCNCSESAFCLLELGASSILLKEPLTPSHLANSFHRGMTSCSYGVCRRTD